jgi:hypothetical protein
MNKELCIKVGIWNNSILWCTVKKTSNFTSHVSLYLPICVLLLESTHYFCISCVKIAFVVVVENLVPFNHIMVISDSEWNPFLCSRPMNKKAPQKVSVVDFLLLLSVFHKINKCYYISQYCSFSVSPIIYAWTSLIGVNYLD